MAQGVAAVVEDHFADVTDPRCNRGNNHNLIEMIFIALTASICGADGWADVERFGNSKLDWFLKFIELEHGVPSHDTFGRVFRRLDTGEFLTAMHAWVDAFSQSLQGRHVAIDGKTLRGSFDRASEQSPLHLVTAFATDLRLCLRQMSVDGKSNEIPAVRELLELMELSGATVTADAMHCQVETAQAILDAEADYVLTVKRNQETLYHTLLEYFSKYGDSDYKVPGLRRHVTNEKSHGRDEYRACYVIAAPKDQRLARWPGLKTIGMIYRRSVVNGKVHEETMFLISSHPPKVKKLAGYLRDHWSIENSQHWVLDVTFAEDSSRIRRGSGPAISGAFRRLALNILQQDTTIKENIRGKRLRAGWDEEVLDAIYAGFTKV